MRKHTHPGYGKPYYISTVIRYLALQEGCDGESHDAMIAAADELDRLYAAVTGLSETDPLKMTLAMLAMLTRQYDQHDRVWNIIEEQRKTIAEMQKTIDMLRMHPPRMVDK